MSASTMPTVDQADSSSDVHREIVLALLPGSEWLVEQLWRQRPYCCASAMVEQAARLLSVAPRHRRVAVVDGHTRLGERASTADTAGELSRREQSGGRPGPSAAVLSELRDINSRYERAHSFRLVVHVDGRPLDELLPSLRELPDRDTDDELTRGVGAVIAIADQRAAALWTDTGCGCTR